MAGSPDVPNNAPGNTSLVDKLVDAALKNHQSLIMATAPQTQGLLEETGSILPNGCNLSDLAVQVSAGIIQAHAPRR